MESLPYMSYNNLSINKKVTSNATTPLHKFVTNNKIQEKVSKRRSSSKGYTDPQGTQGVTTHREYIFPQIRRRNKETHRQLRRVCQRLNQLLENSRPEKTRDIRDKEISKALVSLCLDKAKAPKNSQLAIEVEDLKSLLTVFKPSSLIGLEQLAQGKTAKVLVDTKREIAYKLIEINDGEVGGTFPNNIRIRSEDNQIIISGCKTHSLLKMLKAIEISNEHGGPLFTELAGFTEDGDIITCQPYIKELISIDMFDDPKTNQSLELNQAISKLGLKPIGDIGSPFAIGNINGKYAIFDDLHGDNVLKTKAGKIYLVDSLATRYLTQSELTMLKDYLPNHDKQLFNQKFPEPNI